MIYVYILERKDQIEIIFYYIPALNAVPGKCYR